jgi:hypothetical protein
MVDGRMNECEPDEDILAFDVPDDALPVAVSQLRSPSEVTKTIDQPQACTFAWGSFCDDCFVVSIKYRLLWRDYLLSRLTNAGQQPPHYHQVRTRPGRPPVPGTA